jgi:hypothetical protein
MAGRSRLMTFVAYVDESESRQDIDAGTYILCATVIDEEDTTVARERMRGLKPGSRKKLHWHDDNSAVGRKRLVGHVTGIAAEHVVVIRLGSTDARVERRRRLCVERLIYELHALGVSRVVFESRGPGDKLDLDLLQRLRSKRIVDSSLRFYHLPGPLEPLLWISDIVCGAVTQDRIGNSAMLDPIRDSITFHEIEQD